MTVAAIQAGTIKKRSRTIARPLRVHLSPPREGREFFRDTNLGYPADAQPKRQKCSQLAEEVLAALQPMSTEDSLVFRPAGSGSR